MFRLRRSPRPRVGFKGKGERKRQERRKEEGEMEVSWNRIAGWLRAPPWPDISPTAKFGEDISNCGQAIMI